MIFKKNKPQPNDQKINLENEEVILTNQAEKIAHNIPPTKLEQLVSGTGNITSAVDNLKNWTKKNDFEKKTKEYMQLLTDGVVVFVDGLIKEK